MNTYEGISTASPLPNSSDLDKMTHFIRIYDSFLSDALCNELIHHLNSSPKIGYQDLDYLRRQECMVSMYQHPDLFDKLKKSVQDVYKRYKIDIGPTSSNLYQANTLEFPNVVAYNPNPNKSEHFSDHADAWHFDSTSRQVSIIMYLSDVAEGGSTAFTYLNYKVNPVKGRVLVFPSNFMFMHRAEPPISDTKYACIAWIHFDGPTKYISIKM